MLMQYDASKMHELLKSFYQLSNIRIVVFDVEFQKIAEYPQSDSVFCSAIRKNLVALKKCLESDRIACQQCKKDNKIHFYTCHTGLAEVVAPIHHGNIVIGYIMFGQILLCDDPEQYWKTVWKNCMHYGVAHDELKSAYQLKTPLDLDQMYASAKILEACVGYLRLERIVSLLEDDLPKKIDDFITENLSEQLSVDILCKKFGVNRSKLNKILNEFYGKSLGRLTTELRIERAKYLLLNSKCNVNEIASKVGFFDYNYFIKVFKKETGTTPKQFSKSQF